ncbi:MAG: hypothetical protein COA97_04555 [Flavobacteriales bacterium]|nr:MAG: hypothetical protein COA97_04555 [Flavobacteriales bacterium]
MNIIIALVVSAISGLYTSLWGAFKDSPYEGLKPKTFPRSIYFNVAVFIVLYASSSVLPVFNENFSSLKLFQIFFLTMGIERFLAEIYKGFFRIEDQSKYFIPSRVTLLGKPVESNLLRYILGSVFVIFLLLSIFLPFPMTSYWHFLAVAYLAGLFVSFGGAYKDAPFEGFDWIKFQRSSLVLAVFSPLFYFINSPETPVSLGLLIYMNGGLERFSVEYFKTYIQRNMSGKFKSDTKRIQKYLDNREKWHYMALVIIISVGVLYYFEL